MDDNIVIIGIDPSSKKLAAVTTVGDGGPTVWTARLTSTDIGERAAAAYGASLAFVRNLPIGPESRVFVFIEDPVVGRGGARATIVQAKVHGAVVAAFHRSGKCEAIKVVNNSHAKKKIVGKGNASKDDIKEWCRVYWRQAYRAAGNGVDQDLLDAAMINRYGAGVIQTMDRMNTYRRRSLKTLRRKP